MLFSFVSGERFSTYYFAQPTSPANNTLCQEIDLFSIHIKMGLHQYDKYIKHLIYMCVHYSGTPGMKTLKVFWCRSLISTVVPIPIPEWRRKEQLFVFFHLYSFLIYITDKLLTWKFIVFYQKNRQRLPRTRWHMKWLWKFINSAYDEIYFIYDNKHSRTFIIYKGLLSNFPSLLLINSLKTYVKN